MVRKLASLIVAALLVGIFAPSLTAEEEPEIIVIPHLGGELAVSLEVVETVFFMEKDGKQRLHLVWKGNPSGNTIEGPDAVRVWKETREAFDEEFLWVSHMGGLLGIASDAVTSLFFMGEKDGKPATLRVNYGSESKTIEGAEAVALWKSLGR